MCKKFLILLLLYAAHNVCVPNYRAPRPDALSYPGSSPQIVSPFDSALLAGIKKCICELKNQSEECCASIGSHLDEIDTRLEIIQESIGNISGFDGLASFIPEILSILDNIALGGLTSQLEIIESLLEGQQGQQCCSIVEKISTQLDAVESLVEEVVQQGCGSSTTIVVSSIESISTLIENTTSIVEILSTQIDTIESLLEGQQCCSIVEKISTQLDTVESLVEEVVQQGCGSSTEIVVSSIDSISTLIENTVSIVEILSTQLDTIESLLEGQQCCSIVEKISTQLDAVESLVEEVVQQGCGSSTTIVVSSIESISTLIENTVSIVEILSTQLDTIESLIENQVNCCSDIANIAADLSLLPVIDSKCDAILFDVGSRSDFAFSNTDQLSTIEQIDALDISVIAWLKTIMADLHGL